MTRKTKVLSYDHKIWLFWLLAVGAGACLFLYVYAVNATARNIAERQGIERQIAQISSELQTLEFSYIEMKNKVTIELAYEHGFREAQNPLYVSRTSAAALSFNDLKR